jgi:hypothetical protein
MSLQSEKLLNPLASMKTAARPRDALQRELAAEILERFSALRFVAYGTSMLPSIYPGDCLTVESFGLAVPSCGEIVLCRRGGTFCVHRIVGISGERSDRRYILRGDALLEDDPPVPARELLGRVTSVLRRGKPLRLDREKGLAHGVLRSMVRRLHVTSLVLLSWHGMLARKTLRKSAEIRTECV